MSAASDQGGWMRHRTLGRTNLAVSELGFGTWGIGDWLDTDLEQAVEALKNSVQLGVNFYDTAHSYGGGLSEELLGCLRFESPQTALTIATKVPPLNHRIPASGEDCFQDTYPLEHVRICAEQSRDRLGVKTIDLLQFHVWHDDWVTDPLFRSVVKAIKGEGIARFVGISLNAGEPDNGIKAVRSGLVDTVQVVYNLIDQTARYKLFPACYECGVGVIVRVPLDEGCLVDGFGPQTEFTTGDWRASYFSGVGHAARLRRRAAVRAILPEQIPLSHAALRFSLAHPAVSNVIVGMRSRSHVEQNCKAITTTIEPDLLSRLQDV